MIHDDRHMRMLNVVRINKRRRATSRGSNVWYYVEKDGASKNTQVLMKGKKVVRVVENQAAI